MRLHRQFFSLFLSIIAITISIILVQVLVLVVSNHRINKTWRNFVVTDYLNRVVDDLNGEEEVAFEKVAMTIVEQASERVSGLIFRSSEGLFGAMYGTTSRGEKTVNSQKLHDHATTIVSSTELGKTATLETWDNITYKANIETYTLNLKPTGRFFPTETYNVEFKNEGRKEQTYTLPPFIEDSDIAATIKITRDGEISGYLDILVYSTANYGPTNVLSKAFTLFFFVAVLFALLISVLFSYIISKRNEKKIVEIQNALESLARNEYGVKLSKQKSEELDAIVKSIENLDENLKRHQASRKEWIRSISHDLNTPITSLALQIEGALDGVFPLNRELLLQLKEECDILNAKISSVHYYAHLLSPDVRVSKMEVDGLNFIDTSLSKYTDKEIFVVKVQAKSTLYLDNNLSSRAFDEVIKNAIQNNKYGSPISIKVANNSILVTNYGELPTPLPDFFEPWSRGDVSRTKGGAGLGLPIAGEIMKLQEGSILISQVGNKVEVSMKFQEPVALVPFQK